MEIILSLFPVILFLAFLFLLDSFKLVRIKILILCMVWGIIAATISYFANTVVAGAFKLDFDFLSRYVAPVMEETIKALFIFFLILRKKIGFLIDAAIYGFAIGTGFSVVENIYYLVQLSTEYNLLTWVVRGFGTAIMHGGCTALMAILSISAYSRVKNRTALLVASLIPGVLLHSGFNISPLNPILETLLLILILPAAFTALFRFTNRKITQWLEIEFTSEIEILAMIHKGDFRSTKAGIYLLSVREFFTPEAIVDLYCYISLHMELSIKAKRNLLLRENDLPVPREEDLPAKLKELSHLRKQIGITSELALAPFIPMSYRNLWELNLLNH